MASGVFTVQSNSSLLNGMVLSGGTWSIGSGATLTLGGTTSWIGTGQMTGGGTVRNAGIMIYATTVARSIPTTFENTGSFTHSGLFVLQINSGTSFENQSGGVFNLSSVLTSPISRLSSGGAFNNSGTIRKTNTGTTSLLTVPIYLQNGTVEAQQGQLDLGGSGTVSYDGGQFIAAAGAILRFSGGSIWKGRFTGSGAGQVKVNGRSYSIDDPGAYFDFPNGLVNWTASTNGGTMTVEANSYLDVSLASTTTGPQFTCTMNVLGTLTRSTGGLFFNTTGVLNILPAACLLPT